MAKLYHTGCHNVNHSQLYHAERLGPGHPELQQILEEGQKENIQQIGVFGLEELHRDSKKYAAGR